MNQWGYGFVRIRLYLDVWLPVVHSWRLFLLSGKVRAGNMLPTRTGRNTKENCYDR